MLISEFIFCLVLFLVHILGQSNGHLAVKSLDELFYKTCQNYVDKKDVLFSYESSNSGCRVTCWILITPLSNDSFAEYYTQSTSREHKFSKNSCGNGKFCFDGNCQPLPSRASTQRPTLRASTRFMADIGITSSYMTTTPATKASTMAMTRSKFRVNILVRDGYIPHQDAFSVGDIKVKIYVNNRFIGNTRKVQDETHPAFYDSFDAHDVNFNDTIFFSIWDMDPQWDDLEGSFETSCQEVTQTGVNGTPKTYHPRCVSSTNCWLKVTISCN